MKQDDKVKDFFGKYSSEYASSTSHSKGKDLAKLISMIEPKENHTCADFACGTGFTAIEIAKLVDLEYAIDTTEQMIIEAKNLASGAKLENIVFLNENITKTSLKSDTIDIVTCRRAAHHFEDKRKFLMEVRRVLRKGGRFGLVDMVRPPEDDENVLNKMEIIRDRSHVEALSEKEWLKIIVESGFKILSVYSETEPMTYDGWLKPVKRGSTEDLECTSLLFKLREQDCLKGGFDRANMKMNKTRFILVAEKL
ncbi:MAG: class I SAM-dependent methyltransferase [Thermoplasmataceae archaeon]